MNKKTINKAITHENHDTQQSHYDAKALGLTTSKELQQDIQEMYAEAEKNILAVKDKNKTTSLNNSLRGMLHYVNETNNISKLTYLQVLGIWNRMVTMNKNILNFINSK